MSTTPVRRGIVSAAFAALAVAVLAGVGACAAVYPEFSTRTKPVAVGIPLDPGPPADVRWLRFVSARIPEHTRDGRTWKGNGKADPYAKLLINGKEVLKTSVQSDTMSPTWPGSPKGNFKIGPEDKLRVELWASGSLTDEPVGVKDLGHPTDEQLLEKQLRAEFPGGGELMVAFEPAHATLGLGLWYELRTSSCYVTRMLDDSPAQRASLLPNDEVVSVGGRPVKGLSPEAIQSAFNAVPLDGILLTLRHPDGTMLNGVRLKEGPIYPLFAQVGPIE